MATVDKRAFGNRVTDRRKALGLSQEALASLVGMKQQGVDNIEQGKVARPRLMRELASALVTTEDWLLWHKGPENIAAQLRDLREVRLISWVSAGKLADAQSQIPEEDSPRMAFTGLGSGDFFALQVQGSSMDRFSPDGSIIVVNRTDREPIAGKPYVFLYAGDTTYKLWQPDPPRLEPWTTEPQANPAIYIKRRRDLAVIGRVRRTLLDL